MKQLQIFTLSLFSCVLPSMVRAQPALLGEGDPHANVEGAPSRARTIATNTPDPSVPAGTIEIEVVDPEERPVAAAAIDVGVMGQQGDRDRKNARTDATGHATVAGLSTGPGQAYRVNLRHQGATYSSTPFQLPAEQGMRVRIVRLAVTRANDAVIAAGQAFTELREERLHVSEQMQILNLGQETYVLPDGGLSIPLPAGALAFAAEPSMTDQRLTQEGGRVLLRGSIPPGSATIGWSFDLRRSGDEARVTFAMPMRTFFFQIAAEAPAKTRLGAEGFPAPERAELSDGRTILTTALERRPEQGPITAVEITLSDLPGPSPLRWIALAAAAVLAIAGIAFAAKKPATPATSVSPRTQADLQNAILAEATALDTDRRAGRIGPTYFAERKSELINQMALSLRREKESSTSASSIPAG